MIQQHLKDDTKMTEQELQALIDEEQEYIQQWRDNLTQEQINSI